MDSLIAIGTSSAFFYSLWKYIEYYLNLSRDDSYNEVNLFKNDVIQTSLPLAHELNELETKMQKKVIGMIAFLAKKTKPVNTNELYKLLTDEP